MLLILYLYCIYNCIYVCGYFGGMAISLCMHCMYVCMYVFCSDSFAGIGLGRGDPEKVKMKVLSSKTSCERWERCKVLPLHTYIHTYLLMYT